MSPEQHTDPDATARRPDMAQFRRAVHLRDSCRRAALASAGYLGVPLTALQAHVAYDAMVALIRGDCEREAAAPPLEGAVHHDFELEAPKPPPSEQEAIARAIDAVAWGVARRRTLGHVYMGGEHHPTPGEYTTARTLVQDLLDAGWRPPDVP